MNIGTAVKGLFTAGLAVLVISTPPITMEDETGWDCKTMGNKQCGGIVTHPDGTMRDCTVVRLVPDLMHDGDYAWMRADYARECDPYWIDPDHGLTNVVPEYARPTHDVIPVKRGGHHGKG